VEIQEKTMKIVKILKVVDTRKYEEGDDDKFHAVAGSGIEHACDRCGKTHEVHATVLLEDGSHATVGTGCMAHEDAIMAAAFQSMDRAAKRLAQLNAERSVVAKKLEVWNNDYAEVCKLPLPETGVTEVRPNRYVGNMGDAAVVMWDERILSRDHKLSLVYSWRRNRMTERGYKYWESGSWWESEIKRLDKEIAKVENRMAE
jgi:hypothetical protein